MATKILNFISYKDLASWDAKLYLNKTTIFNPNYKKVLFGEFLNKATIEKVKILDNSSYKILGVRSYGKGVYLNRVSVGKDLKMKEYFKAKSNHLFWCKVDTKNGAFGVIKNDFSDGFGSSNMTFAEIDTKKINVDFLQLFFTSKKFTSYLDGFVTGTTNRKYIRPDQLFNEINIPLPTITEQLKILEAYQNKIQQAEDLEDKAQKLDQTIEKYLFEELSIKINNKIDKKRGLNFVEFSKVERWGVEYNLDSSTGFLHSTLYPNIKLKDVIEINPLTPFPKIADLPISFIPMEVVSDDYGIVTELRKQTIAGAKGYTKFKEGDLIWARITPCMQNGKSAILKGLENSLGVGSTEFHVLRNNKSNVSLDYIYHFLRLNLVLKNAMSHFTGSAGQQRVPKSYLEELSLPFPDYSKQCEISEHLYLLKGFKRSLNNEAEILRKEANQEFEQMIFNQLQ